MPRRENTSPFLEALGSRIRDLRLKQGLSLDFISEASGISKGSLSSVENGLVNITVYTCVRIAAALKVDAAELLPSLEAESKVKTRPRGGRP